MDRHCAKPGCADVAVASLSYDYAARTAWIDDLPDEVGRGPALAHAHALCARHADVLTVPHGWRRDDRRGPAARTLPTLAS
jgi:hypothetical protein